MQKKVGYRSLLWFNYSIKEDAAAINKIEGMFPLTKGEFMKYVVYKFPMSPTYSILENFKFFFNSKEVGKLKSLLRVLVMF